MLLQVIFGGGRRNFVMEEDGGKRKDRNLFNEYKKIKESQGQTYHILNNRQDLENWEQEHNRDFAIGNTELKIQPLPKLANLLQFCLQVSSVTAICLMKLTEKKAPKESHLCHN